MDALAFLRKPPKTQPIVVLFGDEAFLVRACREAIVRRVLGDADPEYAIAVHEATVDFTTVRNDLDTMPFLAPARVVIVEGADPFITSHRESLEKYAAKPSRVGVLILEAKTFPETTKLAKALPDAAKIVCKTPRLDALPDWMREWAESAHGKRLMPDAATMLLERIGPRMGLLAAEINKLATAAGDKPAIGPEDVDRLVIRSREANVFHILDAVGDGQPGKALGLLEELFQAGEAPLAVLGALTFQLRRLAAFSRHVAAGLTLESAMDAAGVPKWAQARQSFQKQARHLGRRRLQKLSEWLVDVNAGLKGANPLPPQVQVERLIVRLARPRDPQ